MELNTNWRISLSENQKSELKDDILEQNMDLLTELVQDYRDAIREECDNVVDVVTDTYAYTRDDKKAWDEIYAELHDCAPTSKEVEKMA